MSLYSGIKFVYWGSNPCHRQLDDRFFDTCGIQYNHSGKFYFAAGDAPLQLFEGSYAFVSRPGLRFRYGITEEPGRSHNFVTFTGERVGEYERCGLLDFSVPPEPVKLYEPELFFQIFRELRRELGNDRNSDVAINLLDRLLFMLKKQRDYRGQPTSVHGMALDELGRRIVAEPCRKIDFAREARRIGVSYAHFRRLFTNKFHVPPKCYLLRCRFKLAAQLLVESDLQIQEVARQCGFDDIYFFSKQFKNHFNITPSQFRRNYQ